ncbi:hypothetical protein NB689_001572 [Xanthomonas sacchari]|nr:hypothetical protein [Xanthomonas sacchari]
MLVWKAMPSMTLMMSAIFFEDASIPLMVCTTWPTTLPPCEATVAAPPANWLAWRACSAFWRTVEVSSSIEAAVSSRFAACCSVRRDRSSLPAAISPAAALIAFAACWMRPTMAASCSAVALASSRMVANTPWKSPCMRAVRSPCDSAVSSLDTWPMLSPLACSRPLSCCASCRKKPCLPSMPTRPLRSPAAASRTILATSCSTCASRVRSRDSQTKPMCVPCWSRMAVMVWATRAST